MTSLPSKEPLYGYERHRMQFGMVWEYAGIPLYLCARSQPYFARKIGLPETTTLDEIGRIFDQRKMPLWLSKKDIPAPSKKPPEKERQPPKRDRIPAPIHSTIDHSVLMIIPTVGVVDIGS